MIGFSRSRWRVKILGVFGRNGRMPGELNFVHHLAVDPDGNIFASEIKNQRVQKFRNLVDVACWRFQICPR